MNIRMSEYLSARSSSSPAWKLLGAHQALCPGRAFWKPTLPTINGQVTGEFRMIDFLAFAGVDPTSRGSRQ
jgi:hypothetical protein